jgi:Bifunctional DNA primase/polymerase, N-terminal
VSGTEPSVRMDAALGYARVGWPVFPCVPGEKIPCTGRGFLDASTHPDRIREWWGRNPDRNVAIATGWPGPDVLDVDNHGERGSGFAAFNRLKREGLVPDPVAVVSTPSGGFHAYFRGTEQRNGHLPKQHLDYRAQGGYVVAPPSTVGGRPYEVVSHQASAATFGWDAARTHLEPEPKRQAVRQREADGPRDITPLAGWVAALEEGNRNAGLHWAACRAVEAGRTDFLDSLAKAAQSAGLDEREADRTIRSAVRGAARPLEHQREAQAG